MNSKQKKILFMVDGVGFSMIAGLVVLGTIFLSVHINGGDGLYKGAFAGGMLAFVVGYFYHAGVNL